MVIELSAQEAEEKLNSLTGDTYRITGSKWVRKAEIKKKYGIPERSLSDAAGQTASAEYDPARRKALVWLSAELSRQNLQTTGYRTIYC